MAQAFGGVEGCVEVTSGMYPGLHHAIRIENKIPDC